MHTFHIPVMGLSYTIDTPIKVAPYGISSVISIVDDSLIEKMREHYSQKFGLTYNAITEKMKDFRAERIRNYLDLVEHIVTEKFESLKNSIHDKGEEIHKYIEMLPERSELKAKFQSLLDSGNALGDEINDWILTNLNPGSIDVNIMTKLDKDNYDKDEKLPVEFNDAHAALRGFATSKLKSSIVFSAGMNPRLYSYMENFEDFYPDKNSNLIKKIILKVSDYRSALIQGKFLAKKGLWVSEYRVESGLNCGGHAFASDGYLLGPILEEFRQKRSELRQTLFEIYSHALKLKARFSPEKPLPIKLTAQGGVGTSDEHSFLLDHYNLDSVGWGSPFLLVPEAVSIDDGTMEAVRKAKEDDLYLSGISPLGVPFNSLRNNTQDIDKLELINKGRPGSSCPKKYLQFNTEFTDRPICTASRQYQHLKINELEESGNSESTFKDNFDKITEKACICVGLSNASLLANDLEIKGKSKGVSVCPGPNIAYFDKILTLKEMISHIYGRINVVDINLRPNLFIKEMSLYINYLRSQIVDAGNEVSDKQKKYFEIFRQNLIEGMDYYHKLFADYKDKYSHFKDDFGTEVEKLRCELLSLFRKSSAA